MAQIDSPSTAMATAGLTSPTKIDIRHWAHILLLASFPVIPMPIAGGIPILIAVTFGIYCVFFTFPSRAVYLDNVDLTYIALGFALLTWEGLGLFFHISNDDVLLVLARGLWIAIAIGAIMATNLMYNRAGLRPITTLLVLGLLFLLFAMWIEITYFPKSIYGRSFGPLRLPFPRATGVPNSDGKLGTFLSVCLCYFLFLRPPMPKWQAVVLCVGPFLGMLSLQSRSTLVAFSIIIFIYFIYSLFTSRSKFGAFLKLSIALGLGGFLIINILPLIQALIGQGGLKQNVYSRFEVYAVALRLIPEAPFFGAGATVIFDRGGEVGIHNTFLSMAVKSGLPSAILSTVTIFAPAILFFRNARMSFFVATVCLAMFAEHLFYPGRFNENQILCFVVAKLAWQYYGGKGQAYMVRT